MARPAGWRALYGMVDEDGWLIPYEATLRANLHRDSPKTVAEMVDPMRLAGRDRPQRYFLLAGDVMDDAFLKRYNEVSLDMRARDFPMIPAWLGEHLPFYATFLDNGEIAAYGALDLHIQSADDKWKYLPPPGERWYHYSADGQLLGETKPQDWTSQGGWVDLFFPDYDKKLREVAVSSLSVSQDGPFIACIKYDQQIDLYAPLEDRKPPEVFALFNYKGEQLDTDQPLKNFDTNKFTAMPRDWLQQIYDAQVRLGLADPHVKSPWLGKDGGPVMVDPAPRPPKQVARSWGGPSRDCVVIHPLDDPDNPYAGQYQEWDRWCYENIGKQNPETTRKLEQQQRELQEKLAEYREKGEKPPQDLYTKYWGVTVDPDDPWKDFSLNVDADGYIKPLVDPHPTPSSDPFSYQYDRNGPFTASAGGIMPEEMLKEYTEANWLSSIANDPQIPEWLAAAPPWSATTGPNGEWITEGPLGCLAQVDGLPRDEFRDALAKLQLHRYSAQGELLEVAPAGVKYWPEMYAPELADRLAGYSADPDCSVQLMHGFIRVYQLEDPPPNVIGGGRRLGQVLAQFDWQGHELDADQTPQWDGVTGREVFGSDLKRVYDAQQAASD